MEKVRVGILGLLKTTQVVISKCSHTGRALSPSSPQYICFTVSQNYGPTWIRKGSWREMAAQLRPDAKTSLLGNLGI